MTADPRVTGRNDPLALLPEPAPTRVDPYAQRPSGLGTYMGQRLQGQLSMGQPYEPPAWARALTLPMSPVTIQQPSQSGSSSRPGFPVRIQAPNVFSPGKVEQPDSTDPLVSALMGSPLGVGLGAVPGEQRGGFYNGWATTPMTMANFPTYGREGLVALLSSLFLNGAYQQQEGGGTFGQDTEYNGPDDPGLFGAAVRGVIEGNKVIGDALWGITDGITSFWRQSEANYRATEVQKVFQTGNADRPVLPIEAGFIGNITASIFGFLPGDTSGAKYSLQALQEVAARENVDLIELAATRWDLPTEVVAEIARNPYLTDQQRDQLVQGVPISRNAGTAMLVEGGFQLLLLTSGYMGASKALGMLNHAGRLPGAAGQFANALRPVEGFMAPASMAGQVAKGAGFLTRKALQLNAMNTAAGWSVRGFEWGTKQVAGIMGDQGLVDMMDRLLWEMPWSMNPGLNLIDGFTTHPIRHLKQLREPGNRRIVIGDEGSFSEAASWNLSAGRISRPRPVTPAGNLDVNALIAASQSVEDIRIEVAGAAETLPKGHPMARLIAAVDQLTMDDIHALLFRGLGWDRGWLEMAFGDGSPYKAAGGRALNENDLKNFLIYGYGQVVRDQGFSPLNLPGATLKEKSRAFFLSERPEIIAALESDLKGETRWLAKSIRGQWWELSALNDSRMVELKGRLAEMYEPRVAFDNLMHWLAASKSVEQAYRAAGVAQDMVPTYARRLVRPYIKDFRAHLLKNYAKGQRVSNQDVLTFRARSGPVEKVVPLLKQGRRKWTREQLIAAIDVIEAADDAVRSTRPVARADPHLPDGYVPGQSFAADGRVLGVAPELIPPIWAAMETKPRSLPPTGLLMRVAKVKGLDIDVLARDAEKAWDTVIDWYQTSTDAAGLAMQARGTFMEMGESLRARAAMDATDQAAAVYADRVSDAIDRVSSELINRPAVRPRDNRPPPEGVTYADPDGLARWSSAAQRAESVAKAAQGHLEDPARDIRLVQGESTIYAAMSGKQGVVDSLEMLARYVREHPGEVTMSEVAQELVLDPSVHPLLKANALREADWSGVPRGTVRDTAEALSIDGDQLARELANEILGPDEARSLQAGLDAVTARGLAYRDEGMRIAEEILAVDKDFSTIYGYISPETRSLWDRMKAGAIDRTRTIISGERRAREATVSTRRSAASTVSQERAAVEATLASVDEQIAVNPLRTGPLEFRQAVRLDGTPIPDQRTKVLAEKLRSDLHAITGLAYKVERVGGKKPKWKVLEGEPVVEQPRTGAEGTIEQTMAAGDVAESQRLNVEEGVARGGTVESGGAVLEEATPPDEVVPAESPPLSPEYTAMVADAERLADEAVANRPPSTEWASPLEREVAARVYTPEQQAALAKLDEQAEAGAATPRSVLSLATSRVWESPQGVARFGPKVGDFLNHGPAKDLALRERVARWIMGATDEEVDNLRETLRAEFESGAARDSEIQKAVNEWFRAHEELFPEEVAPEPAAPVYGVSSTFQDPMTEATRPITGRFRLVEADDIIDSWDEGYDQSLQPRKTGDPVREATVAKIARGPDPDRLLDDPRNASEGMPLITEGGMAFVGNHRVRGVKVASDEAYSPVKTKLAERAKDFGFTPEQVMAMRKPMVVRELPAKYVTPEYARAFNEATGGMTIAQTAAALARELDPEDLAALRVSGGARIDDLLEQAGSAAFIRRIIEKIPERGRAQFADATGLTPEGRRLVKISLIARVLKDGDVAARVVETSAQERGPATILARGIQNRASQLSEAEMLMSSGQRAEELRVGPLLSDVYELLSESQSVSAGAGFGADPLAAVDDWLVRTVSDPELLGVTRAILKMRNAQEVSEFLEAYTTALRRSPDAQSMGMFDEIAPELAGPPPRWTLLNKAITAVNEQRAASSASKGDGLLELAVEEVPLIPDPDGVTRVTFETADGSRAVAADRPILGTTDQAIAAELQPAVAVLVEDLDDVTTLPPGTGVGFRHQSPVVRAIVGGDVPDAQTMARDVGARLDALQTTDDPAGFFEALQRQLNSGNGTLADLYVWRLAAATERYGPDGSLDARFGGLPMDAGRTAEQMRLNAERVSWTRSLTDTGMGTPVVREHKPRTLDPDFRARTGVDPDLTPERDLMAADRDAGEPVIVGPENKLTQRLSQEASGLPRRDSAGLNVLNEYDSSTVVRRLEDRRTQLIAQRDALIAREAEVQAMAEATGTGPVELDFPPELAELWGRYMADDLAAAGIGGQTPARIGEVYDALRSLDYGVPPRIAMSEEELLALRDGLRSFVTSKLDEWGAPRSTGEVVGLSPRVPGVPGTPTEHYAMLEDLVNQLQTKVFVTDEPLEGYLGVGYEFTPPPTKDMTTPRLFYETVLSDELQALEEAMPGLGDEMGRGRMQDLPTRFQAANDHYAAEQIAGSGFMGRLRVALDTAVGPRSQRTIDAEAFERFVDDVLRRDPEKAALIMSDPAMFEADEQARIVIRGLLRHWHDQMKLERFGPSPLLGFRRVGLVNPQKIEAWTQAYLKDQGDVGKAILADLNERALAGEKYPTWAAWRKADNRIRAYFSERPGGVAEYVERIYEGPIKRGSEVMSGVTVLYHAWRFLMDARFMAMELVEMPALVLGREGPGALAEAIRFHRGKDPKLLFTQGNPLEKMMEHWAYWAAQSDPGGYLRFRENGILAIVKREGEKGMVKELERMARQDPRLRALISANDDSPLGYLRRLDRDWRTMATRSRKLEEREMRDMLAPYLEEGTLTKAEAEAMVANGSWVGHPGLEAAIAHADDPITRMLLRRLNVISEQAWQDASGLIFGQVDRSNLQRLLNHPLLYWPISYQIKATKWLGGLMLDRAFGLETGAGGAVTMGMLWESHKDAMANDPVYQQFLRDNSTLLFVAQMFLPITPGDIGVSLSPFTRLAHSMVFGTDVGSTEPYRRNIFSVGTGYSVMELWPRLFAEQAEGEGLGADVAERLGMAFPRTITLRPSTSQIATEQQRQLERLGGMLVPQEPAPAARYAP